MSERNVAARTLRDLGLAIWAGGALMGAVGLNGATADAKDPIERVRLSSLGWARWAPVDVVAITAHGVGGVGLLLSNRRHAAQRQGVRASTVAKTLITLAAAAVTAYSGVLGGRVDAESHPGGRGAVEPAGDASPALATAQGHLKVAQWVTPVLTAALVVITAQQGEDQRPGQPLPRDWDQRRVDRTRDRVAA